MAKEQEISAAPLRRIRSHAHLPVVFAALCLALLLIDRLVSVGGNLSQGAFGAGYLAVLFSIALPFLLYWLVGKVSGWRDFPSIFLDFVLSLPAAVLLFPSARGKGFLFFSGLILAAAFLVTLVGERRRARRREARLAAAAEGASAGSPSSTTVHGTTRLETYKAEAQPASLSLGRTVFLWIVGFLLVLGIEYLFIAAVRGMVASRDGRTRYTSYLLILSFPAVLYWAVHYVTRRGEAGDLFFQGLCSMGILALLLPGQALVFQLLWYPPTCYGLVFFMDRMDRKRRLRRYAALLARRPPGVRLPAKAPEADATV